jgi:hypothetical protein
MYYAKIGRHPAQRSKDASRQREDTSCPSQRMYYAKIGRHPAQRSKDASRQREDTSCPSQRMYYAKIGRHPAQRSKDASRQQSSVSRGQEDAQAREWQASRCSGLEAGIKLLGAKRGRRTRESTEGLERGKPREAEGVAFHAGGHMNSRSNALRAYRGLPR